MEFQDELRLTGQQKQRIYKKFMKVVKARDSQLIDKALYDFLYLRSGFIAHYDRHGFIDYYDGRKGMIELLEELLQHHYEWGVGSYTDIGNALKAIARELLPVIRFEVEEEKRQRELSTLEKLAVKHGYHVGPAKDTLTSSQLPLQLAMASSEGKKQKRDAHCEGQLLLMI
ncbi:MULTISPECIES: hypothetical protein [unclassified Paenibacillus]|uniref:hypothetical protein n=1 Tax=unclassified Paenibacillus TaxID=185978 RepID=UPI0027805C16|nr:MULTISPECIES: hypothetical protein [unclassified Paenibacillus]MDQ0896391.1 hypothetical protein [Paenibacillus sp. V4I7]MDQ0914065.1 hypothetical protein [Paenibacillus sp. V4I5]